MLQSFGFGPNVTPPPGSNGDLFEPKRAFPVPFCLYGFLPPPRTSLFVKVDAVPLLAFCLTMTTYLCTIPFATSFLATFKSKFASPLEFDLFQCFENGLKQGYFFQACGGTYGTTMGCCKFIATNNAAVSCSYKDKSHVEITCYPAESSFDLATHWWVIVLCVCFCFGTCAGVWRACVRCRNNTRSDYSGYVAA